MKEILLANRKIRENATAQIAHLVFVYTLANAEKPKKLFSANAQRLAVSLTDKIGRV